MIAEAEREKKVGWCAPDPGSCAQSVRRRQISDPGSRRCLVSGEVRFMAWKVESGLKKLIRKKMY